MGRTASWADEFTLLCERCGYIVEGLDAAGACPECGKPISESLPEQRVGTPWQRKPGVGSLVWTWWMTVRHPVGTLGVMRFGGGTERSLVGWSIAPSLVAFPVLMLLTLIEARGIRFFGDRHGFRITQAIAWSVCSHGAVGWVIAAIGLWIGVFLVSWGVGESLGVYGMPAGTYDPTFASALVGLGIGVGVGLMLIGFLFFETFAWLGLRRCKYANRVRPDAS